MRCPECFSVASRRHGIHFDHEYICGKCDKVFDPDNESGTLEKLREKIQHDILMSSSGNTISLRCDDVKDLDLLYNYLEPIISDISRKLVLRNKK